MRIHLAKWGALLSFLAAVACGHASEFAQAADTSAPHAWDARRGETVIHITNQPGAIIDTTAPPPPPGTPQMTSAFLSASCGGEALVCSEAGRILRASHSLREFLEGLDDADFSIVASARP